MKIVRYSTLIESTTYNLFFERKSCPGSGFCFDCDEAGIVDLDALNPLAYENYNRAHGPDYYQGRIQPVIHRYKEPAIGLCLCGRKVILDSFTNTCDCGCDYNSDGQRLAPRCQW